MCQHVDGVLYVLKEKDNKKKETVNYMVYSV